MASFDVLLGLLLPDLYVVGLVAPFIGGIGVLVRLVDWSGWTQRARSPRGPGNAAEA
jgi:hypothetical protein